MSRWFRVYDDLVDDPKVQRLSLSLFKTLINLWCLASKGKGILPSVEEIAFKLRMREGDAVIALKELGEKGLLDRVDGGLTPHKWSERQYLSESSNERVKRHRLRRSEAGLLAQWAPTKELRVSVYKRDNFECVYCSSPDDLTIDHKTPELRGGTHDFENLQTCCRRCNAKKRDLTHDEFVTIHPGSNPSNAPVTVTVTAPEAEYRIREQNTEAEKKETRARSALVRPDWPPDYQIQFWIQYPNKVGKPKALESLDRIARSRDGPPFAVLMAGLLRYTAKTDDRPWCNPATWLNQERWDDQPARVISKGNGNGQKQHPADRAFQLADELESALKRQANPTGDAAGGGADAVGLLEWQRPS